MRTSLDKNKVILGLSGGVDSTAAALLLQEQGYQVTGLFFDVTEGNEEGRQKAQKAAEQIGIPFIYKNVHDLFERTVIDNFCSEYLSGRTPNPCIYCNPTVKFRVLIEEADKIGAFHIATGHYAKTAYNPQLGWTIRCAENIRKDQSYMLYRLPATTIERLLLPLHDMKDKEFVREIARGNQIFNAEAKDSQEICFVDDNYADFIFSKGFSAKEGNFINKEGEVLGQHKGLIHYTIGQRKGLGVTFGKPVYVTKLDPVNNTVTLGDHEELFSHEVICKDCFFPATGDSSMPDFLEGEGKPLFGKIRYAAKPSPCTINKMPDGTVKAVFQEKQRAATPGQSVVFYYDNCIVGGGFID